jgi:hypothetical protein
MQGKDISAQIDEVAEYARVLDASVEDHNVLLVRASAAQIEETASRLYAALDAEPKAWRNAVAASWLAKSAARRLREHAALLEADWGSVGAAVSFTCSGVDQLVQEWHHEAGQHT